MTKDQKTVAIGAALGVVMMVVLVWVLAQIMPVPELVNSPGRRLSYATRWSLVAALPLFCMIVAVGNARFLGEAIDPTAQKEDRKLIINGRVADNTTQQFLLFLVGILALSVSLPFERMSYVPAVAITFVICRIVFWIGYRINPMYRAPGFASTAYLNLFMYIAVFLMRAAV